MKIVLFGPALENSVSANGWLKYVLAREIKGKGHTPISVAMSSESSPLKEVKSYEDRLGVLNIVESRIAMVGNPVRELSELLSAVKPDALIVVDDQEKAILPILARDSVPECKMIFYFISEAPTLNRYMEVEGTDAVADLKMLLKEYNVVIPATPLTKFAAEKDIGYHDLTDPVLPAVFNWETNSEKNIEYRKSIKVDALCNLYYCIATNTARKRLDQVLLYFRFKLMRKACDKLVLRTSEKAVDKALGGVNISDVAMRLGIIGNVRIDTRKDTESLNGLMAAGDTLVAMPAAEGYNIPLFESLLLGKKVIHTSVGYPGEALPEIDLKGKIKIVKANVPYFYTTGSQVWYAVDEKMETYDVIPKKGKSRPLSDFISTPEEYSTGVLRAGGLSPWC